MRDHLGALLFARSSCWMRLVRGIVCKVTSIGSLSWLIQICWIVWVLVCLVAGS